MGFKPPTKLYELDFTDSDYEGLEVTLKGVSTGQYLELQRLIPAASTGDPEAAGKLMAIYQKAIVSWNIEDDAGRLVKPTMKAILDQDLSMTLFIIGGWTGAIAGVKRDLGKESDSGRNSAVEDLPTEAL